VSAKKKILIITDGTESIQLIANSISDAMEGCKVAVCSAEKFEGTDLLPVDTFILGCEKPNPPSFAYLQEMLSHINLASRICGVFSTNEKALRYLRGIVKDCEAELKEPLLITDSKPSLKKWLKGMG